MGEDEERMTHDQIKQRSAKEKNKKKNFVIEGLIITVHDKKSTAVDIERG